jgi:hypothetical protein
LKIQQFLEHHGLASNPFADEDAQTDPVFKDHCIDSTFHPSWDKVYGNPAEPATSIVFGEKGSGKTAMRLQIVRHLAEHNATHPDQRLYVIEYDDFNPFLDRFASKLSVRKRQPDRVLAAWKLWDHIDSMLSLGATSLVDHIVGTRYPSGPECNRLRQDGLAPLDRHQARDLLLLAACYDQSLAEPFRERWHRLRRKLRFHTWKSWRYPALGVLTTALVAAAIGYRREWSWLATPWPYLIAAAGWVPSLWRTCRWALRSRRVVRQLRSGNRQINELRQVLQHFSDSDVSGQPLPDQQRTDDRYELLMKFQGILKTLGFHGIIVLVDRVDEPHLINGSTAQMRAFIWSMLDNKLLKHPGLGLKLLLPIELAVYLEREDRDFYQRARLDKQNMIPSLEWTGEALFDVASARVRACSAEGKTPTLREMLDESVSEQRLLDALRMLRVPRHLFKFLYRLFVAHCNAHTDDHPVWRIKSDTFESILAVYLRDQDAVDRGLRAG